MKAAPRLVVGGTGSGCGKTTVTCAVLQAFVDRGMDTVAFKCGPDYIDPMFHSRIIGARSRNLDAFLCGRDMVPSLLAKHAGDISIIEGVMGYYDGLGGISSENSTADLAQLTQSPTVLVVSARGMSRSLAALLRGYLEFEQNTICGVNLNGISPLVTNYYAEIVERNTGLTVYGALPHDEHCTIQSRHLGLVTADEITDLRKKMRVLAEYARTGINLDGLLKLAHTAPALEDSQPIYPPCGTGLRIAMAHDEAFCFDYADSLDVLTQMGAQLVPFSPLHDAHVPEHIDGLLLCGGYPELYVQQLGANHSLLAELRTAIQGGLPTVAECGGFLLLHDTLDGVPMAGICGGAAYMTGRLKQFGYVVLTAKHDTLLCAAGEQMHAHEFHYAQSERQGSSFQAKKPLRMNRWDCIEATRTLHAGYPHVHFAGNVHAAQKFLSACRIYREEAAT